MDDVMGFKFSSIGPLDIIIPVKFSLDSLLSVDQAAILLISLRIYHLTTIPISVNSVLI